MHLRIGEPRRFIRVAQEVLPVADATASSGLSCSKYTPTRRLKLIPFFFGFKDSEYV